MIFVSFEETLSLEKAKTLFVFLLLAYSRHKDLPIAPELPNIAIFKLDINLPCLNYKKKYSMITNIFNFYMYKYFRV